MPSYKDPEKNREWNRQYYMTVEKPRREAERALRAQLPPEQRVRETPGGKEPVTVRVSPAVKEAAQLRAAIEGTNLTEVMRSKVAAYAKGKPKPVGTPEEIAARLRESPLGDAAADRYLAEHADNTTTVDLKESLTLA